MCMYHHLAAAANLPTLRLYSFSIFFRAIYFSQVFIISYARLCQLMPSIGGHVLETCSAPHGLSGKAEV
jgi:hypothetical protein